MKYNQIIDYIKQEKGKDLMKLTTNDDCKITATNEVTAATGTSSKDELAAPTTDAIGI